MAYQKAGDNEAAVSSYKKALRIHPEQPGGGLNLANINYEDYVFNVHSSKLLSP